MRNALSKLFLFIGKSLREDNGNPSSMRLQTFITIIILIPCIAFAVVYTALKYQSILVPIVTAVLAFLSSILGIKAWQKGKEEKTLDGGGKKPEVNKNENT